MSKYKAYTGKIIHINLTEQRVEDFPLSDADRELFLGGKILAARILRDFVSGPIDPLSAENHVVITTGPLNAMNCPSSSRFNVSSISPLTGLLVSSNCGGSFGVAMKKAGYDAVVITGKSKQRCYVKLSPEGVEFLDAEHLWGLTTSASQEALDSKGGKLVIGPAGENLVKYACLVSQERIAGRGGLGAVFGSKNLKAVLAEGGAAPAAFAPEKLKEFNRKWVQALKRHPLTGMQMPKYGTSGLIAMMNVRNQLSTRNFQRGSWEAASSVNGDELSEKHLVKTSGCLTCPIRCGRVVSVDGRHVKGPELETMVLLGSNIENSKLENILQWNYELDELGLDSISAAGCIGFAMELHEKGLWSDTDLEFGKSENISKIFHDIAYQRGVGAELAQGVRYLSKKYGGEDFAMHCKGMEFPAYEPRGAYGQGLGYATSNRGGCHLNGGYMVILEGLCLDIERYTTKGKANLSVMFQNFMEVTSACGSCLFTTMASFPSFLFAKPNSFLSRSINTLLPSFGWFLWLLNKVPHAFAINISALFPHSKAIYYATGMKMSFGKALAIGSRGYNLERMINNKLGVQASDDVLPKRMTDELQIPGDEKSKVPLDVMKKAYYKIRGWDDSGQVTKKTLKKWKLGA